MYMYTIQTTISHGRIWGKFLCCLYVVLLLLLLCQCYMHILAPLLVQRFAATVGPNQGWLLPFLSDTADLHRAMIDAAFVIFRVFVWVIVVSLVMYYSYSNCPVLFFILICTQVNCLKIEWVYIYHKVSYSRYDGRGCMLEISLRAIATLRRASLWTQGPIVVMILNVNSFSNQTNYIGSSSSSYCLMKLVSNE